MSAELDKLTAEVEESKTVKASAAALMSGLSARVKTVQEQLAAANVTNTALNQLADDLSGSSDALAEAIVANTPAEPSGARKK